MGLSVVPLRARLLTAFLLTAAASSVTPPTFAASPPSALMPGGPAKNAPTPPPTPRPSMAAHPFSLTILSVDPPSPAAGQQITINYAARNLAAGTVLAHLTASVAGGNPQTLNGRPAVDTAYPENRDVKGSFVISGGPAGSDPIELTLSSAPCGVTSAGGPACASTVYARASTMVTVVAPPTVRERIAGTTYAAIVHADSRDGTVTASGYTFVVHDPGCRSNFSSGNNGNDTFFTKKDLPAGASLKAVDFSLYRVPPGLTTEYYAGGVGGSGSYGVKLVRDSGNALHVHWENACRGPYETLPVVYSISFEIDAPSGSSLGEAAAPATQQPYPPSSVNYGDLGVVAGATNAAAASVPGPVGADLTWNGEAFSASFAPAHAGTVSAIANLEPYPIVLIADARLGAGCAPTNGNVLLPAHGQTSAAQLATLYGSASVHSPKTITACSQQQPLDTKSPILLTLTFLAD